MKRSRDNSLEEKTGYNDSGSVLVKHIFERLFADIHHVTSYDGQDSDRVTKKQSVPAKNNTNQGNILSLHL